MKRLWWACAVLAWACGLMAWAGCSGHLTMRAPTIAFKARAQVHAQARPPPVPVPIHGATVVEFFGVPLEDAQDVVFLLDSSGSMAEPASAAIARAVFQGAPLPGPHGGPPLPTPPRPPVPAPPMSRMPKGPWQAVRPRAPGPPSHSVAMTAPVRRKIDVAHAELVAALERLPPGTRLNVLFFNDSLEAYAPQIVEVRPEELGGLVEFVRATEPWGPTALATAMRTAFVMEARHVVLLSDGLGNVGGDSDDILRDAREAMLGGVRIDTIGLGPGHDAALMSSLAAESGGVYQSLR